MSITRSRAALCVVDPGTRPARYGRWSDGIFRKYSVRINSEQEAKHGKKKERAPSTPREPVEYSRANSVGRRRRAPATARLRGRRARSVGQAVFTLIIISSRVRHRRPTRGRAQEQPGVRRSDTHFTPHTLIIKTYIVIANLLLFICVCRHEKDRKMNSLCQA